MGTSNLIKLALRAIQLQDIGWRAGEVSVRRTKGKRDRVAPLFEETGAALADYVLRARPKVDSPYLFLSFTPPVAAFKCASPVSRILRKRLRHGGVELGGSQVRISCATVLPPSSSSSEGRSTRSPIFSGPEHQYNGAVRKGRDLADRRGRTPLSGRRRMTAFARFLGEKAERYIELRHSLGYAFSKQAGTLRAFVRYVERAQLDAPATRTMALDFALSFGGAANSRVTRHGVLRRFYEYLAVYDVRTKALERRAFPRSRAITPPRILTDAELASLIDACARISPSTPLRGRTMATLIGLLASSGLRSGVVVRLDRSDVDLANGVLLVRKTKFRKDRLVPVHTTTPVSIIPPLHVYSTRACGTHTLHEPLIVSRGSSTSRSESRLLIE
ncbi:MULTISPECIES: tyrosine-type recombinase/integrase [unclassified Mesorhizobium]|uniref:tyrosine-type recombinase/integrase n=1 Tax=unclassified Mesorhizobium TaxID=325217 RepID=UPI001FEE1D66|nr:MULTISPECIES: tyrosine-type recombinase/integrase [unclassified Mesorhizobium]